MFTEIVNGRERQVWSFKKGRFHGPIVLGAGYRDEIEAGPNGGVESAYDNPILMGAILALKAKPKPHGYDDKHWNAQLEREATEIILKMNKEGVLSLKKPSQRLHTLQVLMTPFPGQPSVKEWYMELAEPEEVQRVFDFFEPPILDKSENDTTTSSTGAISTPARKRAHSKTTSRKNSGT